VIYYIMLATSNPEIQSNFTYSLQVINKLVFKSIICQINHGKAITGASLNIKRFHRHFPDIFELFIPLLLIRKQKSLRMKKLIYLSLTLIMLFSCKTKKQDTVTGHYNLTLSQAWATDSVFKSPESVFYDKDRNQIYVSNINGGSGDMDGNGFMSKLSSGGEIIKLHWIDGLNGPKGMDVYEDKLYVADINRVAEINLNTDSIEAFYTIDGAQFLNDLSIDNEGGIYISDSQTNRIYLLRNGQYSVWLASDSLGHPNGLYFDGDVIWHASSGKEEFQSINLSDKTITIVADSIGHGDGIAPDGLGNFIVSDWEGELFFIDGDGNKTRLMDTRAQHVNSADIGFIVSSKIILVPTFNDNRIMAYTLSYN
jgi:sugar lactone lactonase YvrE